MNRTRIACFGGVYSNYLALESALEDIGRRGVDAVYCLGDFGAFGPHPNRAVDLLRGGDVACIQGNYDNSIGNQLDDCQCGYVDPRDNHFAQISYEYTLENTSAEHREWMRALPSTRRLQMGPFSTLLCHGSPRRVNEFLWESTTSDHFLEHLLRESQADVALATHTGVKWQRRIASGRQFINVGVLGRPENDGAQTVWYAVLESQGGELTVEFTPVEYDYRRLAREMLEERLPQEFVDSILTGWWTTCLEIMPSKERRRGKF